MSESTSTEINKSELRSRLAKKFSKLSGLRFPKDVKALNKTWWTPLLEISALCDYDETRTVALLEWSLAHADDQPDPLTIISPASIHKIAIGEQARRVRTDGRPRLSGSTEPRSAMSRNMTWIQEMQEERAANV